MQEPFGAGTFGFSGLHQRDPQGAGLLDQAQARSEFAQFDPVGVGRNGRFRSQHGDDAVDLGRWCQARDRSGRKAGQGFGGWTDHSQNASIGAVPGQMLELDGPQGPGRSRVAGQDHQRAPLLEQPFHGFQGESLDDFRTARTVRRSSVVGKVQEIVPRQTLDQSVQHRQTPEAGIEDTYHRYPM